MRVAIVHDWLTGMRGGERCLEVFCQLFPQADLYTLIHLPGTVSPTIERMPIRTSFLQHWPGRRRYYRSYLPLMPLAIESFDLSGYDLVLSSSHCVAKGVITSPRTCHICYCYTPMRYVWDQYQTYFGQGRTGTWLRAPFIHYLRLWDAATAHRVGYFVAISNHVAGRIRKYYGREAPVIYPPVNTDFYTPAAPGKGGEFYLMVTALSPYKRVEVAIEAFNRLAFPLKIIGSGPLERRLRRLAKGNVELLGWVPDEVVRDYYARCRALIFPGEEDFGIVPLEAQAAGRPVIALARGGVLETVTPATGIFFDEPSAGSLAEAVQRFEQVRGQFDPQVIRAHARQFDLARFREEISRFIADRLQDYGVGGHGCDRH